MDMKYLHIGGLHDVAAALRARLADLPARFVAPAIVTAIVVHDYKQGRDTARRADVPGAARRARARALVRARAARRASRVGRAPAIVTVPRGPCGYVSTPGASTLIARLGRGRGPRARGLARADHGSGAPTSAARGSRARSRGAEAIELPAAALPIAKHASTTGSARAAMSLERKRMRKSSETRAAARRRRSDRAATARITSATSRWSAQAWQVRERRRQRAVELVRFEGDVNDVRRARRRRIRADDAVPRLAAIARVARAVPVIAVEPAVRRRARPSSRSRSAAASLAGVVADAPARSAATESRPHRLSRRAAPRQLRTRTDTPVRPPARRAQQRRIERARRTLTTRSSSTTSGVAPVRCQCEEPLQRSRRAHPASSSMAGCARAAGVDGGPTVPAVPSDSTARPRGRDVRRCHFIVFGIVCRRDDGPAMGVS